MIEFDKKTHTYTLGGVIIPSVSEVLKRITGKNFDHVPPHILRAKAEYGSEVHEAIEAYIMRGEEPRGSVLIRESVKEAARILESYEPVSAEQIVHFGELYAGTYDLLARKDSRNTLFDYKTSAELDENWLKLQLNAYRIAYEFMTGEKVHSLVAIWLPKNSYGRSVEIPLMDDDELLNQIIEVRSEQ